MRIISAKEYRFENEFKFSRDDINKVQRIIDDVIKYGDKAVIKYTKIFDGVRLNQKSIRLTQRELREKGKNVCEDFKKAILLAKENIEKFSKAQLKQLKDLRVITRRGVNCSQHIIPIKRVGIYVPAGNFPLVSTLIMCAVPAIVAGVEEIALFSPPRTERDIHISIIETANILGINEVYRVGGVQAIAAMAYGTETIAPVNKIVGPGNKYVAIAKKEVSGVVGIDMIAGPSEVMIIADSTSNPDLIAADMIAQAEHDVNASAILLTTSISLARKVIDKINLQIEQNPNRSIISKSLENNGFVVLCREIDECVKIANARAPEHLEVTIKKPNMILRKLKNYGSLFVGEYSAEVFGDYTAGVNHTLPTNGVARYRGGLSVFDFVKITTSLTMNKEGYKSLKDSTMLLARVEGLIGHLNAAKIRDT